MLVLSAAAKSLQSCPTLFDPIDGSPPGSPFPGISRQEHWSGLPFPSPMHESEKWKWSRSVVSDPQRPHGLQPTRLLHPWDFPGKLLLPTYWINHKDSIFKEYRSKGVVFSQFSLKSKPFLPAIRPCDPGNLMCTIFCNRSLSLQNSQIK